MLRFQQGDREAFAELVRRNTNKIHALIYRFLGEPSLVDDLTQEVFLRVYRTAANYRPTAKFSTWLYRITANLSFNVIRSRRKGQFRQIDSGDGDDGDGVYREVPDGRLEAPHEAMDAAELRARIAWAVDALPESQKAAIILNKFEEMSYEEISSILGCSTMAVKSLLSRARANLRRLLAPYLEP